MKNRLLALLCFLLWPTASAGWEPLFSPQELCTSSCSGRWSRPQLSLDLNSVVVAESRGQVTSLWKIEVGKPQNRVLVYRGAVQSWTLDAAPALVVLRPDGTLLSYDMTRRTQRWSISLPFPVPGRAIELLIAGELLALTGPDPADSPILVRSASGQTVGLRPGFELRRVPATASGTEPLPATTLNVLEETRSPSTLAFRLTRTPGGAVRLEGYTYQIDAPCIACGFNK